MALPIMRPRRSGRERKGAAELSRDHEKRGKKMAWGAQALQDLQTGVKLPWIQKRKWETQSGGAM